MLRRIALRLMSLPSSDLGNPTVDLLRSNLPARVRGRWMAKVKHVERTYVKSEFRPLPKVNGVDRAPSRDVAVRRHDRLEGNDAAALWRKSAGNLRGLRYPACCG